MQTERTRKGPTVGKLKGVLTYKQNKRKQKTKPVTHVRARTLALPVVCTDTAWDDGPSDGGGCLLLQQDSQSS